jgi:uncharacterized coiled-coil protein SlyX
MPLNFQIESPTFISVQGGYKPAVRINADVTLNSPQINLVEIKVARTGGNIISTITISRDSEIDEFVSAVNSGTPLPITKSTFTPLSYFDLLDSQYDVQLVVKETNGAQSNTLLPAVSLKGGSPSMVSFVVWLANLFETDFGWDNQDVEDYVIYPAFWGSSDGQGSYTGGDVESWYDEYVQLGGTQPEPPAEDVVEALTGEVLGCVNTINSITYTHGFATLDDGSCQPACNATSAAILQSQIDEFGQDYVDQLDSEQITCLIDEGYGDPTVSSEPIPTIPFDEEAAADEFFDNAIGDGLDLDCLPEDWDSYFDNWFEQNYFNYEEVYTGEGLNYDDAADQIMDFISNNPNQYPMCDDDEDEVVPNPTVFGCTYPDADNYNPNATVDNGSCTFSEDEPPAYVLGCTYPDATNFNPQADYDDGSCVYPEDPTYVEGCVYPDATNYNPNAEVDDGSCIFPEDVYGCTDVNALNYNPDANVNDGTCEFEVLGCTDTSANNYNSSATTDDGSCNYDVLGCTDPEANNYLSTATVNDGSCEYTQGPISGCQDPMAYNYNPSATTGGTDSCQYAITEGEGNPYTGDATDLIATLGLTNDQYVTLINDTIGLIQQLQTELENCPEDQTETINELNNEISELEDELDRLTGVEGMLTAVENTISNIADSPCNLDDPATDALFTAMSAANVNQTTIDALEILCTSNIGVTSEEYNTLLADLNAVYEVIGGIYEDLVDVNNPLGYTYNYESGNYEIATGILGTPYGTTGSLTQQTGNIQTVLDGIGVAITDLQSVTPEDGVTQAQLDVVQNQLDVAVAEVNEIATMLSQPAIYTAENVATASDNLQNFINLLTESAATLLTQNPSYDTVVGENLQLENQIADLQQQINNAITTLQTALETGNYTGLNPVGIEAYATAVNEVVTQLASVDITSDNQASYDEGYGVGYADGVASVDTSTPYNNGYADGLLDGAAGVDITTDNQASYDEGYGVGYSDGVASVDITSDNEGSYDDGYADGVASVDITTDNQSSYDAGYLAGVASVDITSDNQEAFDQGVSSVDITTDNQAAYDEGYADGEAAVIFLESSYNQGFSDGAASVDITVDNQAQFDLGYGQGYSAGLLDGTGESDNELVISLQNYIGQLESLINDQGGLNDQIDGLNAQLASTEAAMAVLESELASVQQELANAEASISAYEGFLSDLDVGMSRLEKFLIDSYNYTPYQRSSLSIPTNMSERNPNFNNEEPNMLDAPDGSVYVGDGQPYQSVAYGNYLNSQTPAETILGCTDPNAPQYNPNATADDGSCWMADESGDGWQVQVFGCTDPISPNYNPSANTDDGSCVYDAGGTPVIPEGTPSGPEFAGRKKKQNKVSGFLNIMGKANHIKQGFSNFAGQEPFLRTDGDNGNEDNGEEKTFELTKTAKTFLYLTGGALAAFGIYKALKKK